MVKKIAFFTLIIVLCLSLSACGNKNAVNSEVKNQDDIPTKEDELYKYNAYIDLNNYVVNVFSEALDSYFKEFGNEQEPRIRNHFSYTPRSISKYDREKLDNAIKTASLKPSYEAVDGAMKDLYPSMAELMNLFAEARSYYELKNYVDDNFAKGKELHKKILAQYQVYEPLADKFCNSVTVIAKAHEQAELEAYKNNGQMLKYYSLRALIRAEDLQGELDEQKISGANLLELDVVKYKNKYDLLVEDVSAIMEYSKKGNNVKGENSEHFASYIKSIGEVKAAATQILERVQQKRGFEGHDLSSKFFMENRDGSPEKYNRKLTEAIREYNRLR